MNRDVVTTIGGLVLVGIVVVATFLYGNQQRQAQLRHDQTAQRQSQQQTKKQSTTKAPAVATTSNGSSSQQPAAQKPSASNQTTLQGGDASTPSPVPSTGSTPAETPKTGSSSLLYVVGATLMVLLYRAHRRSRLAVMRAALKTVRTGQTSL